MKQILLLVLLFFINFQLPAQVSLRLNPDLVMMDADRFEFETVAHSYIRNIGTEPVTVRWIRQVEAISMGWQSAICDINACYSVDTDTTPSDFLLTLAPGDSSMLDVHVRPAGIEGGAKIKVIVEEVANPGNMVTGEFLFNEVTATTDIRADFIKIYPNPALDYFQLTDYDRVDQVVIFNLIGQELRRFNSFPGASFNISNMPRDFYLVRLLDKRNKVIKTFRLNKR
jgi:hypothetical protein